MGSSFDTFWTISEMEVWYCQTTFRLKREVSPTFHYFFTSHKERNKNCTVVWTSRFSILTFLCFYSFIIKINLVKDYVVDCSNYSVFLHRRLTDWKWNHSIFNWIIYINNLSLIKVRGKGSLQLIVIFIISLGWV